MRLRFLYSAVIIFLIGVFGGCSTEKNTKVSRAYHNLTAKYNVYFNANESVKSGVANIEEQIDDDFTRMLPLYKDSDPAVPRMVKSDMEYAIVKCAKLIDLHSITAKPKRRKKRTRKYQEFASQEEFNKWIDDAYLLMGRAYFYQHNYYAAIDNFSYVVRKYPQEETASEAQVWLIRAYTELGRFVDANEVIQAVQAYENFPKRLEDELAVATANYYIKQQEYNDAVRLLDIAVKKTKNRGKKARLKYIQAQLYEELGMNNQAAQAFLVASKISPDYALAFNAKINSAGVFSGEGDATELKKTLNKMLRDKKNEDFRDQIYYALGNIFLKEGNRNQAKENYRKSVALSFKNQYQRALSAITLADLYFEDRNYTGARAYYDSAMIIIDETYPNYKDLSIRYKNLSSLVDNLQTVQREDSLQRIAMMPESERDALISEMIRAEQERQRNLENVTMQDMRNQGYYRANQYRMGLGQRGGTGWYFYNPQTVAYGRVTFAQQWGKRPLEDDWRRSNKNTISFEEQEQVVEAEVPKELRIEDPLKKEFYTQDLPLTDSLMEASHQRIRDALYNAGKLFKTEFEDYQRSVETFEELNRRYPDNLYALSAYFDLYDSYELLGNQERAEYYRNLIISNYPDSKYAHYLVNPNFFVEVAARQDSLNRLYREAYRNYKAGRYPIVPALTAKIKQMQPDSLILPKVDFIETVALGTQGDVHHFESLLSDYLAKYPDKEPSPLTKEILTLIQDSALTDYQKLVEQGYIHEEIQNEELLTEEKRVNDEFGGKFDYDEDLLHYFVIAYPRKDEGKIDLNRLKFDIANYNIDYYTKIDYDIETDFLNDDYSFVVVRSMQNKDAALIYHGAIIRKASVFKALKGIDYYNFVISSTNYRVVKEERSITDYLKFFVKNYSRFVRSNFSDEEPDISPEELMARAEREENALKEKGRFVAVTTAPVSLFDGKIDTTQNFVLAVKDTKTSMRKLLQGFSEFNRNEFRSWNLALKLKQAGDYQMMVVNGIPSLKEAMSYFRRVVVNRRLFEPLGQASYRNFLISDQNLVRLIENKKVDEYINFFRNNYIQRKSAEPTSATSTAPAGQAQETTVESQTPVTIDSPYSTNLSGEHKVVFVIPSKGVNKASFVAGIEKYTTDNFGSLGLAVRTQNLDAIRDLVVVNGLEDRDTALKYFRNVVQNRALFAPLGGAQYRNFLISNTNFEVFLQEKNISKYMDFYKSVYLKQ